LNRLPIEINGHEFEVKEGTTVAVALINAGVWEFRRGVKGDFRGPLCAMGTCYECRVEINGESGRRACMQPCSAAMVIRTDG
jgi:sarcosine oxidase subunit alpha